MIEFIASVDYEIYGNGTGSLRELVYEPTERLAALFRSAGKRFAIFIEVAELEMIERDGSDRAIGVIKQQIRRCHQEGFEVGLHLHPWWYNSSYVDGSWILDYSEYNLCTLSRVRIEQLIDRSIAYLRYLLDVSDYSPLVYRAGHLLFQPTEVVADVLSSRGIRIDSSVYKGGRFHQHQLDYRPALRNGYFWRFKESAIVPDPTGPLYEIPIYTRMVPTWSILTKKRIALQRKGVTATKTGRRMISRAADYCRFAYPLKLDFCSMTIDELTQTMDIVVEDDLRDPASFKPIVGIGHTKELVDFATMELLLAYLQQRGIKVSTFEDVYRRLISGSSADDR